MVKKAKAAGQFLGGILNNPFVALLLLGIGALLIFRGPILKGFSDIGESFGKVDIQLPTINLPEINFPEFPKIEFPEFPDFSNIFSGFQNQLSSLAGQVAELEGGTQVQIPPDTTVNPDGTVSSTTPPVIIDGAGPTQFGLLRPKVFDTLTQLVGLTPSQAFSELKDATTLADLSAILDKFDKPTVEEEEFIGISSTKPTQFIGAFSESGGFVGGGIFPTPIQNLSLSQIIDQFGVTASQAANIKAIAGDDFPSDFDFGTNTGSGIGSVTGLLSSFIGGGGINVSDPNFQGLSATEIAAILTGGNISNF